MSEKYPSHSLRWRWTPLTALPRQARDDGVADWTEMSREARPARRGDRGPKELRGGTIATFFKPN